jgi:hypothetical protein
MGIITTTANSVWRDYVTDGVSGSGPYNPTKAAIRSLFATIDAGIRLRLATATTFYVDPAGTNSILFGLAPGAGAFQTMQFGIDTICNIYDVNRQNVVLQVADGTWTPGISLYNVYGWSTQGGHSELIIRGKNMTTPANCLLSTGSTGNIAMVGLTTPWRIEGFRFVNSSTAPAIACDGKSFVYVGFNDFGPCGGSHLSASYGPRFFGLRDKVDRSTTEGQS